MSKADRMIEEYLKINQGQLSKFCAATSHLDTNHSKCVSPYVDYYKSTALLHSMAKLSSKMSPIYQGE